MDRGAWWAIACGVSKSRTRLITHRQNDTGCLGLVHWDDPEGWYGGEERGGFRMGSMCMPVADSF